MALYSHNVERQWSNFIQGQKTRRRQNDRETKKDAIKHQKELEELRLKWQAEEKELIKKHLKEDDEKRTARAAAEETYAIQHLEAIRQLAKPETTSSVGAKDSSGIGHETPPRKIKARIKYLRTPTSDTRSEEKLSPFERRRNANMAINRALLGEISSLVPPPAKRQRTEPSLNTLLPATPPKAEDNSSDDLHSSEFFQTSAETGHNEADDFGLKKHRIAQQASLLRNFFMVAK